MCTDTVSFFLLHNSTRFSFSFFFSFFGVGGLFPNDKTRRDEHELVCVVSPCARRLRQAPGVPPPAYESIGGKSLNYFLSLFFFCVRGWVARAEPCGRCVQLGKADTCHPSPARKRGRPPKARSLDPTGDQQNLPPTAWRPIIIAQQPTLPGSHLFAPVVVSPSVHSPSSAPLRPRLATAPPLAPRPSVDTSSPSSEEDASKRPKKVRTTHRTHSAALALMMFVILRICRHSGRIAAIRDTTARIRL